MALIQSDRRQKRTERLQSKTCAVIADIDVDEDKQTEAVRSMAMSVFVLMDSCNAGKSNTWNACVWNATSKRKLNLLITSSTVIQQ